MDHQCSPSMAENRIVSLAHRDVTRDDGFCRCTVRGDREVLDVACMRAFWVFQPMLFMLRVEVAACGLEIRRLTGRVFMNVNCVLAGRQISEIERHFYSMRVIGCERSGSDTCSLRILQMYDHSRIRRERSGEEAYAGQNADCF